MKTAAVTDNHRPARRGPAVPDAAKARTAR